MADDKPHPAAHLQDRQIIPPVSDERLEAILRYFGPAPGHFVNNETAALAREVKEARRKKAESPEPLELRK